MHLKNHLAVAAKYLPINKNGDQLGWWQVLRKVNLDTICRKKRHDLAANWKSISAQRKRAPDVAIRCSQELARRYACLLQYWIRVTRANRRTTSYRGCARSAHVEVDHPIFRGAEVTHTGLVESRRSRTYTVR